ncbi:hypothetical protein ES702_06462 [subsurface metagenome]
MRKKDSEEWKLAVHLTANDNRPPVIVLTKSQFCQPISDGEGDNLSYSGVPLKTATLP